MRHDRAQNCKDERIMGKLIQQSDANWEARPLIHLNGCIRTFRNKEARAETQAKRQQATESTTHLQIASGEQKCLVCPWRKNALKTRIALGVLSLFKYLISP